MTASLAGLTSRRRGPTRLDHPDLGGEYQPGPEVVDPFGNGGGGNGGGGNGGGGNGGGGNGGGHRPPPVHRPGRGPTAWDVVAIGLATAAFADRGGVYAGEGVLIGQPVCGSGPTIVESQPVVIEAAAQALPESAEPAAPEVDEPSRADALPRLEVGLAFELPANGLGVDAGRVAVAIGPVIVECPVMAWDAEGLTATVPAMTLATPTRAELIVSLADGSLAAAMPVHLIPAAETE